MVDSAFKERIMSEARRALLADHDVSGHPDLVESALEALRELLAGCDASAGAGPDGYTRELVSQWVPFAMRDMTGAGGSLSDYCAEAVLAGLASAGGASLAITDPALPLRLEEMIDAPGAALYPEREKRALRDAGVPVGAVISDVEVYPNGDNPDDGMRIDWWDESRGMGFSFAGFVETQITPDMTIIEDIHGGQIGTIERPSGEEDYKRRLVDLISAYTGR